MVRYYPSFAIKTNLSGVDSLVTADGKPYSGKYYETSDGKFFSGPNPVFGPNEPLIKSEDYQASKNAGALSPSAPNTAIEPVNSPIVQNTNGNEFLLDGAPYSGPYYQDNIGNYYTYPGATTPTTEYQDKTMQTDNGGIPNDDIIVGSDGKKYVIDPQNNLIPLEKAIEEKKASINQVAYPRILQPIGTRRRSANIVRTTGVNPPLELAYALRINPNFYGAPASYQPKPLEQEYSVGFFNRFFVKRINDRGYILEISALEYQNIKNGNVTYDVSLYQTEKTFWKLTGPLNTQRLSQYDIREGIIETNKRHILRIEKTFVGIVAFINGEYTKFARPTK